MEATESDALGAEGGDDPFGDVPADGGAPDPDLVQQGELGGENPSDDDDPLAEEEADPLAEPAGDVLEDPEPVEEEPDPEPPAAESPDPEPEPAPGPEEKPEPKPEPKKKARKPSARKGKVKKGERGYVVLVCDKDDSPTGIAGEVTARDDKTARRTVFDGMEDDEARLVAIPERYWRVKTLRAKTRSVRDIEEE